MVYVVWGVYGKFLLSPIRVRFILVGGCVRSIRETTGITRRGEMNERSLLKRSRDLFQKCAEKSANRIKILENISPGTLNWKALEEERIHYINCANMVRDLTEALENN